MRMTVDSHLTITTDLVNHYLEPVELPQITEYGYLLPKPIWVSEFDCDQTLFEVGSDRSWKMSKTGMSIIGRNEHSTIVVENLLVSRCHAAILHHHSGRSYLVDLGSAHGTFIGKQALRPLTPTMIPEGALIRFGIYGNQFVLKQHAPLKIVLSEDINDTAESYINTLVNRTISFPGYTCEMEIHGDCKTKCGKVGISRHPSREDLHRTETLDSEALLRYQKVLAAKDEPTSPGTASLSDTSSECSSSSSSLVKRRSRDSLSSSDSAKRVRFTAPPFDGVGDDNNIDARGREGKIAVSIEA